MKDIRHIFGESGTLELLLQAAKSVLGVCKIPLGCFLDAMHGSRNW